jgi:hypothetical protein
MENVTAAHRAINGDHQSTLRPIFGLMCSCIPGPPPSAPAPAPPAGHLYASQKKTISTRGFHDFAAQGRSGKARRNGTRGAFRGTLDLDLLSQKITNQKCKSLLDQKQLKK